ncbi:hypothetical protein FRC10_001393 [Ceratobasidium sp. 414]|nr:hypothetical protein FRC10_001393 [Ceratobasidium sp. 414]
MSLCESASLLSQYRYILHKDYNAQRLFELSDLLDRLFPSLELDQYFMPDESGGARPSGPRAVMASNSAPTTAELNAAGVGYHVNPGADIPSDSRSTPLRPRALTGTSNDNPRAAKRRMNNMTTAEEHGHAETPSDVFMNTSPHLGERASSTMRSAYGHNYGHAPDVPHGSPATPFGPAETRTYPMLPPVRPSNTVFSARLPPIHSAPATPAASVASLCHATDAYHQSTPQLPTLITGAASRALTTPVRPPNRADMPLGMVSGYAPTAPSTPVHTTAAMHGRLVLSSPAPSLASCVAPAPPSHAVEGNGPAHAKSNASTFYKMAPAVYKATTASVPSASGSRPLPRPTRIPSPTLGAAFDPRALNPPRIARPSSPHVIQLLSSSPPEIHTIFGPSRGTGEPKLEDADNDDVEEYESERDGGDQDSDAGDTDDNMDDELKQWKATHPTSLYLGGPPSIKPETCRRALSKNRHGNHKQLWEEALILKYYFSSPLPSDMLKCALLPPKNPGKNAKYHASIGKLRENVFHFARGESSLHQMLRDVANTYTQIRAFNQLTGGNFNLERPDDDLLFEINPRIHALQPRCDLLKTFHGWRYICYSRGGQNSWYSQLHAHLQNHPTYASIQMHNRTISPAPPRIGAGNGSRSGPRASGSTHGGSRHGARGGAPKPAAPGRDKGKGRAKSEALPDPTLQNSAVEGSESSLPSAPSSTTISEGPTSMSGTRTRSSAPTDPQVPLHITSHKPATRHGGKHTSSSFPESRTTNSPNDISQATAIEVIRQTQASKREFNEQVVVLKKEIDKAKIALLTREQEKSEHFREKAHELEVARLALEQAKTHALIESQRQEQHERFLLAVRDRGRKGEGDTVYDNANRRIHELMHGGPTLAPVRVRDLAALNSPSHSGTGASVLPPSGSAVEPYGHPSTSFGGSPRLPTPSAGSSSSAPPSRPHDQPEYDGEGEPPEWWGSTRTHPNVSSLFTTHYDHDLLRNDPDFDV